MIEGVQMRKLVANESVSLDGVAQAPGLPDEDRIGGVAHVIAEPLNNKPKYMLSTRLAEPLRWQNSTSVAGRGRCGGGGPEARGRRRPACARQHGAGADSDRARPGGRARLMLDPVVLGGGKRIFPIDGLLRPLRLVDGQVTSMGAILATYARPA